MTSYGLNRNNLSPFWLTDVLSSMQWAEALTLSLQFPVANIIGNIMSVLHMWANQASRWKIRAFVGELKNV